MVSNLYYDSDSFNFYLNLTSMCTMSCTYCIECDDRKKDNILFSEENAERFSIMINKLLESENFNYKYICIIFYGGEPTIHHEIIRKIYNNFKNNDRVGFYIFSNGTLINNIYDILLDSKNKENKLTLQISYDGYNITNENRLLKNGEKSADKVIKTMDRLHDDGIKFTIKPTLPISGFKHLYDSYMEFVQLHEKYNYKRLSYSYTVDFMNYNKFDINFDDLKENLIKIIENELKRIKDGKHLVFFRFKNNVYLNRCKSNQFSVSPEGFIFKCHVDENNPPDVLKTLVRGNISDDAETTIKNLLYYDNYYKELYSKNSNVICNDCLIPVCTNCGSKNFQFSKKETFEERFFDSKNDPLYCEIMKIFSKAYYIFKIMSKIQGEKMIPNQNRVLEYDNQKINDIERDDLFLAINKTKNIQLYQENFVNYDMIKDHKNSILDQIDNIKNINLNQKILI